LVLNYKRRKKQSANSKGKSMAKKLDNLLKGEEVKLYLLYPHKGHRSVLDEVNASSPILIILASTRAGELVQRFGCKIIRLDGIFKHTKLRWPIWSIVVQDLQGHGWPIATIFSSSETIDALYHGL
jgi:hypothetical protein